ncbi:dephospho-CoA kinase [Salegentibacter echinorum]|uniref:Dephospho-CoA kinase n=2 Tax=Salegentibacter echinorum TaxID=1073325 RepID=A0A1M5FCM4_SALEC|nr:dephospho-CoA kinase [Salegentibacter echinorum]
MVVGLTGGIGSGKTSISKFFKELGIPVYIADDAGKRLMETSVEIKAEIIKLLGDKAYQNNRPNRKYIAGLVFKDAEKLNALNEIIHPAVATDFDSWKVKQTAAYVIYEAAILFETKGAKNCDFTILVTANKEERITRLQKRDKSTREEIEARMAKQWPDEKKRKLADFEIENHDLRLAKVQVIELHENLLKQVEN